GEHGFVVCVARDEGDRKALGRRRHLRQRTDNREELAVAEKQIGEPERGGMARERGVRTPRACGGGRDRPACDAGKQREHEPRTPVGAELRAEAQPDRVHVTGATAVSGEAVTTRPSRTRTTRSAACATFSSCVTSKIVWPA